MTSRWFNDIKNMHEHYGVHNVVNNMDKATLQKFLDFRISFLDEELNELKTADNPEDIVDALIDLCVVAVGTLEAFNVDANYAWNEVYKANMNKIPGVKASRPNKLNLPDLIKPEGWKAPVHKDNIGLFSKIDLPLNFKD
jgi:hypothetical protein